MDTPTLPNASVLNNPWPQIESIFKRVHNKKEDSETSENMRFSCQLCSLSGLQTFSASKTSNANLRRHIKVNFVNK